MLWLKKVLTISMQKKFSYYQQALKKKLEQNHYKQLRCVVPLDEALYQSPKIPLINFNSNDFLGLSEHTYLKKKTIQYVLRWGSGSNASRFLPDHLQCQKKIEEKIAHLLGLEEALLFTSDFQAHSQILPTIASSRSLIFIDKHCKNSLFQGAHQSKAVVFRFDHNDLEHLEELLDQYKDFSSVSKIIIVESLYHYDGDYADLDHLSRLSQRYEAFLYVDDSYSLGVEGVEGMGLCAFKEGIDFIIGTFGKACGSYGAYLACHSIMKQYFLNFCLNGLQTTPLPPAVLGAIDAALDLIPDMDCQRVHIQLLSKQLRTIFSEFNLSFIKSSSHIICLELAQETHLKKLMNVLSAHHIISALVHPPQHLKTKPRLRFMITACHSENHILTIKNLLEKFSVNYAST